MVKNLSDVDLVVFVTKPELQPITETENLKKYKSALPIIINHLVLKVGGVPGVEPSLQFDKHSVNFKIEVRGRLVEFNLLPTTEENFRRFRQSK